MTMPVSQTINASDFKARCLDILDRLSNRTLERVTITKRGRIVGILLPPEDEPEAVRHIHGFMRGSVTIPADADLTAPADRERWRAEDGVLHA